MKNAINYYYDIYVNDIVKNDNDYYFYVNNEEYHFIVFDRPFDDIKAIYKVNVEMIRKNILVHHIILNKKNEVVTVLNGVPYILIKLCSYRNDSVFINDINYIQRYTYGIQYDKELLRTDWLRMWSEKIDYYEYQISQLGKKYPILCDSLSYYIGLGENAISYLKNNYDAQNQKDNDIKVVISHKRVDVKQGSFEFYNPINFVIDSRVRDISEYIKNRFFYGDLNIYEIKSYIDNINFSRMEYVMLFARLLFPTYYFDVYDEIINNDLDEKKIVNIIEKNDEYEYLLILIYNYITNEKNIFIEPIEWLIKRY